VLANLFLHYAFDMWMVRNFPTVKFERYVDDAVVHCADLRQAEMLREAIGQRMVEVGLQLHPDKTRIVYCKDSNRRGEYPTVWFTFLGYTFRPRRARNARRGVRFTSFQPAISREKLVEKGREVRGWRLHRRPGDSLEDLAGAINPVVRGWMTYWGRYYRTEMDPLLKRINTYLLRWARKKYKRLRSFKRLKAWWKGVTQRDSAYSRIGNGRTSSTRLDGRSRVTGDCYARFCESRGLKCPRLLDTWPRGARGLTSSGFITGWCAGGLRSRRTRAASVTGCGE
jgi:RNA-directed DNA polymerase